ncbi:MAG: Fe2+-dependent dioxygenase [Burkholderiaceae bacterium]|jgi:PKHD-type hydroxylase
MLVHIPEVLNSELLASFRARLTAAGSAWVSGLATAGRQGAHVKHNQQLDENSALAIELGDIVLRRLERNPMFISAALPERVYPPLFNRYAGGDHFGWHIDNAIRQAPGSGRKLRTDVSATLFLSEPGSYSGGELQIQDTYGLQSVKPVAGDLILYPATSLHQVTPVTAGERLACFFWVHSMVNDDLQRRLLFDLDMTIGRLRAQLGDTAEVLALTNHYHNLLRQWARL